MVCFECFNKADHAHHVVPKVFGGTQTVLLCSECHSKIHGDHLLKVSELTKAGLKKARDAGFWVNGAAPFGHDLVDGKLKINKREQKIILRMESMRTKGWTIPRIKEKLLKAYGIKLSNSSITRLVKKVRNERIN